MVILPQPLNFEWDQGNRDKNLIKHQVTLSECEEIFVSQSKLLFNDVLHSGQEDRYGVFGKTRLERRVVIVFTIRNNKIRVISARDLNKKERKFYEEASQNTGF